MHAQQTDSPAGQYELYVDLRHPRGVDVQEAAAARQGMLVRAWTDGHTIDDNKRTR